MEIWAKNVPNGTKKIREQNLFQDEKKGSRTNFGTKGKKNFRFFFGFHVHIWPFCYFAWYCMAFNAFYLLFQNYCQPNKILTFNQFPIHFSAKRKCLVVVLIRKTLVIFKKQIVQLKVSWTICFLNSESRLANKFWTYGLNIWFSWLSLQ